MVRRVAGSPLTAVQAEIAAAKAARAKAAGVRRSPRLIESAQGMALIQWADMQARLGVGNRAGLARLFHIPNGGARSKAGAGRLKAEGVRSGTWDYYLPVVSRARLLEHEDQPRIVWPGLWIELKVEGERTHKQGGLSDKQVAFGQFVHAQGYATVVAYTWEEARDALVAYLDGQRIPHFWCPEGVA